MMPTDRQLTAEEKQRMIESFGRACLDAQKIADAAVRELGAVMEELGMSGEQVGRAFERMADVLWDVSTPAQRRRYLRRMMREARVSRRLNRAGH
jgi:hypothetical protein